MADVPVGGQFAAGRGFRLDIQGLRGIAVLAVILYHCSIPVVRGGYAGVDVFFVISGFLITSHLFAELGSSGRISLLDFYARRVRRLLVPAVLVISATVVVAWLFGPKLSASGTAKDGAFSAVYLINYHLAAQAVDYQHAGDAASPLQHYWSLAVEEQFYIVWPVLMLVAAWLFRRWRRRVVLAIVVAVVILVSLTLSVVMTPTSAPLAYFSLQTRAWQLGIGAATALAVPALRTLPTRWAAASTWGGLSLVVVAAIVFDDETPWPGFRGLVPVLGAALIIAGGVTAPRFGAEYLLARQPLQFLGKVSYAWYLWHWPAVVLAPAFVGRSVGPIGKIVACVAALALAWLTLKAVEQPILRTAARPRRWLPAGAVLSACAIAVSLAGYLISPVRVDGPPAPTVRFGADPAVQLRSLLGKALLTKSVPSNLSPGLLTAQTDGRNACLTQFTASAVSRCRYGDPKATRTMVLFGDSHADQWTPALKDLATAAGWRLITLTRVGCPLADYLIYVSELKRNYTECSSWRAARVREIAQLRPDLVVVSQSDTIGAEAYTDSQWANGTARTLRKLTAPTTRVVYLGDTPHPPSSIPGCLADNLSDARECIFTDPTIAGARTANAVQAGRARDIASAASAARVTFVRTSSWFCTTGRCPPILGNVLLYRDDSHISSRAAQLLEPLLRTELFGTR